MVSKFSPAEREEIMKTAHELLAVPVEAYSAPQPPTRRRGYDPGPLDLPEPTRRRLDTTPANTAQTDAAHWQRWEDWLAARLATERATTLAAVTEIVGNALGETLGDVVERERARLDRELRQMRLETAKLDSVVAALNEVVASEKAKVLDLPQLPRRNVN